MEPCDRGSLFRFFVCNSRRISVVAFFPRLFSFLVCTRSDLSSPEASGCSGSPGPPNAFGKHRFRSAPRDPRIAQPSFSALHPRPPRLVPVRLYLNYGFHLLAFYPRIAIARSRAIPDFFCLFFSYSIFFSSDAKTESEGSGKSWSKFNEQPPFLGNPVQRETRVSLSDP